MTSTDRFMLASYVGYETRRNSKRASSWMGEGFKGLAKNPVMGAAADFGASSIPVLGGIYGGVRGVADLVHGDYMSGIARLGGAALNLGTFGVGGTAGAALSSASRFGKLMPTITKGIRSAPALKSLTGLSPTAGKALSRGGTTAGVGALGAWGKSLLSGGGAEAKTLASEGEVNPDMLMQMTRSQVMQNPMYAQPAQNPLPNFRVQQPYGPWQY